jgi:RNA polymerase sigma factor (sigma-70 family)
VTAPSPKSGDDRSGLKGALSATLSDRALRMQSDQRLVKLTRAGSGAAFAAIVERYRGPLLGYCGALMGQNDAEDAVQQTFANALPALRADVRPIQLRPWLYRIAHNHAINALNRRGRDYEPLDEQFDGVPQPPDLVEQKERIQRLVAAIDGLPERQRRAIVARELEGRSHDEIARAMRATTPVVRQLIHRARTRLRDTCGFLVPIPWIRWLLVADPRVPAASERLGEAVAGGSAGAGLFKTGAVLLATGAIATGGAGIVAQKHQAVGGSTEAQAQAAKPSQDTPGARPEAPAGSGPAHRVHTHAAPVTGERNSSSKEHTRRHNGARGDGRQDSPEKSALDEGDSASGATTEASHQPGDGSAGDGEQGSPSSVDSGGIDSAEPQPPSAEGGATEGPGSPDSPTGQ